MKDVTIAYVNKLEDEKNRERSGSDIIPRLSIVGFVKETISDDTYVLEDGTGEKRLKSDLPHGLKIGDCVKVIGVSNKTVSFRPIGFQKVKYGEEMMYHWLEVTQGNHSSTNDENNFKNFMDDAATFE